MRLSSDSSQFEKLFVVVVVVGACAGVEAVVEAALVDDSAFLLLSGDFTNVSELPTVWLC